MNYVLLSVAGIAIVVAVVLFISAGRARKRASDLERRVRDLEPYAAIQDVAAYVATQQELARQTVASAERDGQQRIIDAQQRANALVAEAAAQKANGATIAEQMIANATVEGQRIVDAARAQANQVNASASQGLLNAEERQREIIRSAEERAKEIAGAALAAVRDAKRAEETVKALKNVIEGYGDAYLVPPQDLLDELGEAYSFEAAGAQLKEVRAKVRQQVKNGKAATCDYVEEVRRKTAVEFVTDAFNGKVATILADVKDDNYGTLVQRIKDAAALVNENGKAFRDARVAPDYLELRLEEAKWAVATYQLREREREEQRLLKERIREEERAQREYEKALKDAEKEEDLLRKAMEKAQLQFDKATDTQKAKYEEQLKELSEKLKVAEEKGKRALSMAQQTKSGHVYVISNIGSFGEDVFKIGLTRRLDPLDRIRELGDASVPFEFDVHALIPSDDAPSLEHALHKQFVRNQVNKVNPRKEFFRVKVEDIRQVIERTGCNATWTMTAEARQYRETLAVERAMADKKFDEKGWLAQQVKELDRADDTTRAVPS